MRTTSKPNTAISFLILLCFSISFVVGKLDNCLKYQGNQCVQCPKNTHLYLGSCLVNQKHCEQYVEGSICMKCQIGFILEKSNNICVYADEVPSLTSTNLKKKQLRILTTSATNATNRVSKSITIPKQKNPIFKEISPALPYTLYIDTLKFIGTSTFQAIRDFLIKFYPEIVKSTHYLIPAVAQNQTMYLFDVMYQQFGIQETQCYFSFVLIKQSYSLELLRLFSMPIENRTIITINDNNRSQAIDGLNPQIKNIISQSVATDLEYSLSLLITSISILSFRQNQRNVKYYILKYYYPEELKNANQYIEFRVQCLDGNLSTVKRFPNIFYPKEQFIPVPANQTVTIQALDFHITMHLFNGTQNSKCQRQFALQSIERTTIFRVLLQFENKFDVLYQLDTSIITPNKIIYNKTKNAEVKSSNLQTSIIQNLK